MIKSPLDLKDLDITDLIIHRIFLPGQQAHFDVEPSKNVIPLTGKAKITLQQRLTKVLSKGSKCIEMDVDDTDSLEKSILYKIRVKKYLSLRPKTLLSSWQVHRQVNSTLKVY